MPPDAGDLASLPQAEDAEPAPVARPWRLAKPVWYGWQTIVADAGWLGVAALGVYQDSGLEDNGAAPWVFGLGVAGYVLTSPILHLIHGNSWAPWSLLLRPAGPALTVVGTIFLACAFDDREGVECAVDPYVGEAMAIAGLALIVATSVIDATKAFDAPVRAQLAVTPWVSPRADGGGLSLVGRL
jgi:hypothetical protein